MLSCFLFLKIQQPSLRLILSSAMTPLLCSSFQKLLENVSRSNQLHFFPSHSLRTHSSQSQIDTATVTLDFQVTEIHWYVFLLFSAPSAPFTKVSWLILFEVWFFPWLLGRRTFLVFSHLAGCSFAISFNGSSPTQFLNVKVSLGSVLGPIFSVCTFCLAAPILSHCGKYNLCHNLQILKSVSLWVSIDSLKHKFFERIFMSWMIPFYFRPVPPCTIGGLKWNRSESLLEHAFFRMEQRLLSMLHADQVCIGHCASFSEQGWQA